MNKHNCRVSKARGYKYIKADYDVLWRHPKGYDGKTGGVCKASITRIEINPLIRGKDRFRVIIDELIHATCWPLDNDYVGDMSTSIASFLWDEGARFKDE